MAINMNSLQSNGCSSYKVIEVAIAYGSRFCNFFGSADRANAVVQTTVAASSLMFQQTGLCTKLELVHLEGYCNAYSDPYRDMFSGSVCDGDDGMLEQVRRYWVANRAHVRRDVMHLFHGFSHSTNTVGCAYYNALCNDRYGYGVNEITFGGNDNPQFWSMLFAHEMGHSAGASHVCCEGYIMDTTHTGYADTFSPVSVAAMNFFMEQPDIKTCLTTSQAGPGNLAPPLPGPAPTATPAPGPGDIQRKVPDGDDKENVKLSNQRGGAGGQFVGRGSTRRLKGGYQRKEMTL